MFFKTSCRYYKFFVVAKVIGYILLNGSSFSTPRFTYYTLARHLSHHKSVLFLISRHDTPKEGGNRKLVYDQN